MLAGHDAAYIRIVWLVAIAFGAATLVALVVLYRRAARRHELEHAERVIAEHESEPRS
jgi:hypothetical protein